MHTTQPCHSHPAAAVLMQMYFGASGSSAKPSAWQRFVQDHLLQHPLLLLLLISLPCENQTVLLHLCCYIPTLIAKRGF